MSVKRKQELPFVRSFIHSAGPGGRKTARGSCSLLPSGSEATWGDGLGGSHWETGEDGGTTPSVGSGQV